MGEELFTVRGMAKRKGLRISAGRAAGRKDADAPKRAQRASTRYSNETDKASAAKDQVGRPPGNETASTYPERLAGRAEEVFEDGGRYPSDHLYGILLKIDRAPDEWERFSQTVWLRDQVDALLAQTVGRARAEGATWDRLAARLGVTRQAVWQRYGRAGGRWTGLATYAYKQATLSPEEFMDWYADAQDAALEQARSSGSDHGVQPEGFEPPDRPPVERPWRGRA